MLALNLVTPEDCSWDEYLELSISYFKEIWPVHFNGTDEFEKESYKKICLQRYSEGRRFFFLYKANEQTVGLANIYLSDNEKKAVLNIAEFYISPPYRRFHFATQAALKTFNYDYGVCIDEIRVEVDSDLAANHFWGSESLKLKCTTQQNRNIYFKTLTY